MDLVQEVSIAILVLLPSVSVHASCLEEELVPVNVHAVEGKVLLKALISVQFGQCCFRKLLHIIVIFAEIRQKRGFDTLFSRLLGGHRAIDLNVVSNRLSMLVGRVERVMRLAVGAQ